MDFSDLILEVFKPEQEEELLYEQGLLTTPFLAYTTFKKNAFKNLKNKFRKPKTSIGKKAKAKAQIAKEKVKAATGKTSGKGEDATVYKLTPLQIDVMADIYDKYGKELAKEIIQFRKNILAPYQLVKRKVKESSRISSSDITGMTKEQFKSALESGRKKIESRGEEYDEKAQTLVNRIKNYGEQIDNLRKADKAIENNDPIPQNIARKVFNEYGVGDNDLQGYKPEELRSIYNQIQRNNKDTLAYLNKLDSGAEREEGKALELIQRGRDLRSGKNPSREIDLTQKQKEEFFKKGNFNLALGRYMFRKEILNQLKPGEYNVFKSTYQNIIDEMVDHAIKKRKEAIKKLSEIRGEHQLTDVEKQIWKKRDKAPDFSNDISDYYQAVREEDFLDKPIYLTRSKELQEAEQKIENEIRKFERKLQKVLTAEDYQKLKQYRVVNNLISVREMKDPDKLFKSTEQIKNPDKKEEDDGANESERSE